MINTGLTQAVPVVFFILTFVSGCQGCGDGLPQTPEDTVTVVARDLSGGNPEILWQVMPPQYQKDINALVRQAATEMDPVLWQKGVAILTRLGNVARHKKQFVLNSSVVQHADLDLASLAKNWHSVLSVLDALTGDELASLEKMKQFDGGQFLAGTGKRLFGEALNLKNIADSEPPVNFDGLKVTVVNSSETEAKLKVSFDSDTKTLKMTKVDGRWIPTEITAKWDQSMSQARAYLSRLFKEDMPENKPMIMMMMTGIETGLSQLENAKTQTEFDSIVQGLFMAPLLQR
ncbi:MAG: hypothetical protein JXX14_23895 [Deltaproteobacteria bacterium]|nr:hypothetical protein [Deltaproteobacteria bacterium]